MKLKPGLTLIETVIAILIIGISVTALLGLQGALSRGVFASHMMVDRLMLIKNMFIKADKDKLYDKDKSYQEQIDYPPTKLTYNVQQVSNKPIFKNFPNVIIERVEAEWPGILNRQSKELLVMFRFKPKAKST